MPERAELEWPGQPTLGLHWSRRSHLHVRRTDLYFRPVATSPHDDTFYASDDGFDDDEHTLVAENYCPTCERSFSSLIKTCTDDGTVLIPLSSKDTLVGRVLDGRFKIEAPLGAGGMGAVYTAVQTSVGRKVAIKLIHNRLGDNRDATKRFLREARLASKLNHPNSVNVIDFGRTSDGLMYIAMERVAGDELKTVLENGPLAPKRAIAIAKQVAAALAAAHAEGIVHRDLKPANIMVTKQATTGELIKVLDFGIAKMVGQEDRTQLTQTGAMVGTPLYMSPEAVRGDELDSRADLYALGVVLYEMLAGRPPFVPQPVDSQGVATAGAKPGAKHPRPDSVLAQRQAAIQVAYCHAEAEPPPLPTAIHPALRDVVMRLLAKEPDDRYDDAVALSRALGEVDEILSREVHGVATVPPQPTPWRPGTAPPATLTNANGVVIRRPSTMGAHQDSPSRPWWGRVVVASVVAGMIAGGIFLVVSRGSSVDKAPTIAASANEELPKNEMAPPTEPLEKEHEPSQGTEKSPAIDVPAVVDAGAQETEKPVPPVVEPTIIAWRLESTPPAEVLVDGKSLGTTPLTHSVAVGEKPVVLVWMLDGYKSVTRSIVPARDRDVVVFLKKKSRRRTSGSSRSGKKKRGSRAGNKSVDPFAQ